MDRELGLHLTDTGTYALAHFNTDIALQYIMTNMLSGVINKCEPYLLTNLLWIL